jgi:hypothetical protein
LRSSDTDQDADRVQIELLRHATEAQRAALARSLSSTVLRLVRQGIEERNPRASHDEISIEFVAICYGWELAEALKRDLDARRRGQGLTT